MNNLSGLYEETPTFQSFNGTLTASLRINLRGKLLKLMQKYHFLTEIHLEHSRRLLLMNNLQTNYSKSFA